MTRHRSFTGPTHLLSANVRGLVSFAVSVLNAHYAVNLTWSLTSENQVHDNANTTTVKHMLRELLVIIQVLSCFYTYKYQLCFFEIYFANHLLPTHTLQTITSLFKPRQILPFKIITNVVPCQHNMGTTTTATYFIFHFFYPPSTDCLSDYHTCCAVPGHHGDHNYCEVQVQTHEDHDYCAPSPTDTKTGKHSIPVRFTAALILNSL